MTKLAAKEKLRRDEIVAALVQRDGIICQYPDCGKELDLSIDSDNDPFYVTIDHWIPQYWCREQGWSNEEIWNLTNLKAMHKSCNARKADRIPNEDGTLPPRKVRTFRYRRDKRAGRAEFCTACTNGHDLATDEVCAQCGCDAQRFPRWAKVRLPDCDHELFWCWACSIGVIERPSSIGTAMRQADSTELGELSGE